MFPETLTVVPGNRNTSTYPIVDSFYTIQGEGAWAGHAAYFIRLGGCDVGCSWCDTKESWPMEGHPHLSVETLVQRVKESGAGMAVITGGEPTMHDLTDLTQAIRKIDCRIHLETSGAYELAGSVDWLTLSPKKFKPPVSSIYSLVDELKIVVVNRNDFEWAERHAALCPSGTRLLLQPEWDTPRMIPRIVDYVKRNPKWQVSLQIHKYLNIP